VTAFNGHVAALRAIVESADAEQARLSNA